MTQITKDQADAALNTLWITSESCNSDEHFETIKSYINQLEAQRQPVSDEKLMEAVSRIDDEFCSATEFNRELCENDWAIIANALSELETLRDALVKWDSASTNLGQASNLDEWIVLLLEARRQGKEALGDKT